MPQHAHVTTPTLNFGCRNGAALSLVYKVPFTLQEHVKTTKTDKPVFSPNGMNLLPDEQIFVNVLIESIIVSQKELFNIYVDNKIGEIIGDVYCSTCKNEKCVYTSTNKTLVSLTVKGAKPASTCLIFHSSNKSQS